MLQVGDKIRIFDYPKMPCNLNKDTKRIYKTLIDRKRPVRISKVDAWGVSWFHCRVVYKGQREYHWLIVLPEDGNWVKVKPRSKK